MVWAVRGERPDWGEVPDDPLPQRQALVESSRWLASRGVPGVRVLTGVSVEAFKPTGSRILVRLRSRSGEPELAFDRVLSLTGYVPDASLYRQLQVHECYATTAPYELSAQLLGDAAGDCLAHVSHGVDVLRNPEPNFFVLGAKSYGRNSQFLLRNGYGQVAEVVAGYQPAGG